MAIPNYKNDLTMNQIKRLSLRGLFILNKLYLDLTIEEIYVKNNLPKGLENLNILKEINKEIIIKYGKEQF